MSKGKVLRGTSQIATHVARLEGRDDATDKDKRRASSALADGRWPAKKDGKAWITTTTALDAYFTVTANEPAGDFEPAE